MLKAEDIADLGQQLLKLIPESAIKTHQDIEANVQALLQSAFAKLELVSREEFDAQAAVLLRTREKLQALESQIAALEEQLANQG